MRAAVAGAKGSGLRLLAVTVLTSYDDADLLEAGYRFGVVEMVRRRAEQAQALGVDGLVASAAEAAGLRAAVGRDMILVTPGIRPAGSRPRTRSGSQPLRAPSRPARTISSSAGRSRRRPIRARRRVRSSAKSLLSRLDRAANGAILPGQSSRGDADGKGYVISRVDITNPAAYARYAPAATKAIAAHGGKTLARGGRHEALEGRARARNVYSSRQLRSRASVLIGRIPGGAGVRKARPRSRWCWWKASDAL